MFAQDEYSFRVHEDPTIESELDDYLRAPRNPEAENPHELIESIVAKVDEQTPIMSWVRARGYYAIDLLVDEQDEKAWEITEDMVTVAEFTGVADAIVEARAVEITLHYFSDQTQDALVAIERVLPLMTDIQSPRVRYFAHNLVGRVFHDVGDYEGALEHYLSAYEAVRETDDERTVLRRQFLNTSIAYLQSDLRDYESALETSQRAIDTAKTEGFERDLPDLYLLKGYLEGQMGQSAASIASHEEAIVWARQFDIPEIVLLSMNNIGSSWLDEKEFEQAREVFQEALAEAEALDDQATKALLLFNLGYVEVMTGNAEVGIPMMETNAEIMKEDSTDADHADTLNSLIEAYVEAGLFENATNALIEQRDLNKTLHEREREETLSELQTRYEANEQATQIDLLEQRNELQQRAIENAELQKKLFILFAIVVVLGSVLLFQLYRAARRANRKLKDTNRQLEYQSTHDALTALLNRRSFQEAMKKRERQARYSDQHEYPDALLLLDVDFFKKINDNRGHMAGDQVLVELGKRLKKVSRATDMVVRWGGEEFLLYLKEMNPERLPEFTQRVLQVIGEKPVQTKDEAIQVTATAGFIPLPFGNVSESQLNWEKCLQIADMALYIGKVHGRNRGLGVMGLNVPFEETKEALEKDLAGAIEKGWVHSVDVSGPEV
ncbi:MULTISPECIES: tetratricopeptide repeat-containing diguanylate cyclase [Gammaproteobacteria]|uniref:tetratricopeptide repeat-containing diguanylate cyclase n=1 Tax=Gammaproteobacteria TaxID=1236 RepID=UPI0014027752|nr:MULTISPECIES: tetratricopeptide repeat-containing diguanylate cyclase [Gammaproteobacteria]